MHVLKQYWLLWTDFHRIQKTHKSGPWHCVYWTPNWQLLTDRDLQAAPAWHSTPKQKSQTKLCTVAESRQTGRPHRVKGDQWEFPIWIAQNQALSGSIWLFRGAGLHSHSLHATKTLQALHAVLKAAFWCHSHATRERGEVAEPGSLSSGACGSRYSETSLHPLYGAEPSHRLSTVWILPNLPHMHNKCK